MRTLLGNNVFLLFVTAGIITLGVFFSVYNCDFQWLSRFGALVIFIGIVFITRGGIQGSDVPSDVKVGSPRNLVGSIEG